MPKALTRDHGITDGELRVWIEIRGYGPNAFPSATTIGASIGKCERKVRQHIKKLIDSGWLTKEQRPGKTSRYHCVEAPRPKTAGLCEEGSGEQVEQKQPVVNVNPGRKRPDLPVSTPAENGRTPRPKTADDQDSSIKNKNISPNNGDDPNEKPQRKSPVLRRGPKLEKALQDVDRERYYTQYGQARVDEMYDRFVGRILETENKFNYVNFTRALGNWLRREYGANPAPQEWRPSSTRPEDIT